MMKVISYILIVLAAASCTNSANPEAPKSEVKEPVQAKTTEVLPDKETDPAPLGSSDSQNDFEILLPSQYRDWEEKNPANQLTGEWIDLYRKSGKYYIGKAEFIRSRGYSECSGDSTWIIDSKNKTLLFINDPELTAGEIAVVKRIKKNIWPKEKWSFSFNGTEYTLRGAGDIRSTEERHTDSGKEVYHQVEHYKLYLSAGNGTETLLLDEPSFNDTFTEMLFIGDIDRDGKPDFVIGSNRNYEEERVLLFLSSKAGKDRLNKKTSEVAIQFDC